ncbi:hypothetical protein E7X23_26275, partial [Bacteroides fragilis]
RMIYGRLRNMNGKMPFKNVYFNGYRSRNKLGRKMSKFNSGNSPDPLELIEKYPYDLWPVTEYERKNAVQECIFQRVSFA